MVGIMFGAIRDPGYPRMTRAIRGCVRGQPRTQAIRGWTGLSVDGPGPRLAPNSCFLFKLNLPDQSQFPRTPAARYYCFQ